MRDRRALRQAGAEHEASLAIGSVEPYPRHARQPLEPLHSFRASDIADSALYGERRARQREHFERSRACGEHSIARAPERIHPRAFMARPDIVQLFRAGVGALHGSQGRRLRVERSGHSPWTTRLQAAPSRQFSAVE